MLLFLSRPTGGYKPFVSYHPPLFEVEGSTARLFQSTLHSFVRDNNPPGAVMQCRTLLETSTVFRSTYPQQNISLVAVIVAAKAPPAAAVLAVSTLIVIIINRVVVASIDRKIYSTQYNYRPFI